MAQDRREEICPDCLAGEHNKDVRITSVGKDDVTGEFYTCLTWHTDDCPAYTVDRILTEDNVRRSKERTAWMKTALPAAFDRLKAEAAAVDPDAAAAPFVAALLELVGRQAEDLDRFVSPEQWAEILAQHFPPAGGEVTP